MKIKDLLTKADIILFVVLLVLGLGSPFILQKKADEDSRLIISVNGTKIGQYSLALDREIVIYKDGIIEEESKDKLDDEDLWNVVVIKNAKVYVQNSTCEGKDCVHMGTISREGEVIACLPHKLLLTIDSREDDIDVVLK